MNDTTLDFLVDIVDRCVQDLGAFYDERSQSAQWLLSYNNQSHHFILDYNPMDDNLELYHGVNGKSIMRDTTYVVWKVNSQRVQDKINNNYDQYLNKCVGKVNTIIKKYKYD